MEFGVFNSLYLSKQMRVPDYVTAEHRQILTEVEMVRAADRNGFKYAWATEHHFLDEYSHLSANECFLAYCAGVTENIHIGSGIINITPPVNHPARVAERVAMIDHLSNGRFEFGVGRGSSTTEQGGFGIDDPSLTRLMFDETLPEILRMFAHGEYSFDGEYFSMPPRNVIPKPYTTPHPPLWIAAGNPPTFQKAAELGLGVLCFSTLSPEDIKPMIDTYKTEIEKCDNPIGGYVNNNVMVTTQMLCLEDGQRARDLVKDLQMSYHESLLYKYLDTFPHPPHVPAWPAIIPEPGPEEVAFLIESGLVPIGTPEECARSVERFAACGADQLVFGMGSSTMPSELITEAIETFGTHVLPQFDTDPVHSTTRQREAQLGGVPASP